MTLPSPLTSTTFVDGELTNEAKWYARLFTPFNSLLAWAQGVDNTTPPLIGVGAAMVGTAPAFNSGLLSVQAGGNELVTYATGGVTKSFPTAFPNGLLTVIAGTADFATASFAQALILATGTSVSGFKFKAANNAGTEIANATGIRLNWFAIGW